MITVARLKPGGRYWYIKREGACAHLRQWAQIMGGHLFGVCDATCSTLTNIPAVLEHIRELGERKCNIRNITWIAL